MSSHNTTRYVTVGTLVLAGAFVSMTATPAAADSVAPSERTCFAATGTPGDAAVVNLTPVGALDAGSGQLVSSDIAAPPVYSNVNFGPGTIDPNVAVAAIGTDGELCFVNNSPRRTGVIADHMGTIDAAAYTQATPSGAPARVVDTRGGLGGTRLAPEAQLCFAVSGAPGDAAVMNLTPVLAGGTGNGKLISSDVAAAPPTFSNVNYTAGSIDPNVAIATIGADGELCFVNADLTSVDLIADHMGNIDAASYAQATASGAPARVVDSRNAIGGSRVASGDRLCFAVDGDPGDAAVVNLTPVLGAGQGNGQLVSSDIAAPDVYSNVNWTSGSVDPNVAIAEIGADSKVCFVNNGTAGIDLIADHMGTIDAAIYTPASPTGAPVRSLDTRLTAVPADLVLEAKGVGGARFGRDATPAITYFESGLGAATSDVSEPFPIPNSFTGFETADGSAGFIHPHSRTVCFANGFCALFGGASPATLQFVGYRQNAATAPLQTRTGATIGDRGDTTPGMITVDNGGCFSFGTGVVDGVDATLRSDGVPFLEFDESNGFITNTPPLADVVIISLHAGDDIVDLEGDC